MNYLFKENGLLRMASNHTEGGVVFVPPERNKLLYNPVVTGSEVIKAYDNGDDASLFDDVIAHLKRFSYLRDDDWMIIACLVFLTYLVDHADVDYMPMIYFFAAPERGKTRTGTSITHVSYRGYTTADLRSAAMLRGAEYLNLTIFFDLIDIWKTGSQNDAMDIFNARYERSAQVIRVNNFKNKPFDDFDNYHLFGGTIIASNQFVPPVLESRCIPILTY
jgi:hypothetical protein